MSPNRASRMHNQNSSLLIRIVDQSIHWYIGKRIHRCSYTSDIVHVCTSMDIGASETRGIREALEWQWPLDWQVRRGKGSSSAKMPSRSGFSDHRHRFWSDNEERCSSDELDREERTWTSCHSWLQRHNWTEDTNEVVVDLDHLRWADRRRRTDCLVYWLRNVSEWWWHAHSDIDIDHHISSVDRSIEWHNDVERVELEQIDHHDKTKDVEQ